MATIKSKLTQIKNIENVANTNDLLLLLAADEPNEIRRLLGKPNLSDSSAKGQVRRIRQGIVLLNNVIQGREVQLRRQLQRKYQIQQFTDLNSILNQILGRNVVQGIPINNIPPANITNFVFDRVVNIQGTDYHIKVEYTRNQRQNIEETKYSIDFEHRPFQIPTDELGYYTNLQTNLLNVFYGQNGTENELQASLLRIMFNVLGNQLTFNPFLIEPNMYRINAGVIIENRGDWFYSRRGFNFIENDIREFGMANDMQAFEDIIEGLKENGSEVNITASKIIHIIRMF